MSLIQGGQTVPHVVIVGGGFGGIAAARALRKAPVRVTLIDRRNHHLFQPLLYQVATAGLSPAQIAVPIRAMLRWQRNAEVLMGEVTGADPAQRKVRLSGWGERSISYDFLVLATGSTHSYFGHDDWACFAPGLKCIADATEIRERILLAYEAAEAETNPERRRTELTFVIVGGGPTGVEIAGSIGELSHYALAKDFRHIDPQSTRIVLVEAGPRILASFPDELSIKAKRKLEELGVEVLTGARVEKVDAEGVVVNGKRIHAGTVLWAAGVVASPAGKWISAPTDKAGRVIVGNDLTVPSHPEIFVIGDTASAHENGKPLPGVAPVAMQQGTYVGSVIARRVRGDVQAAPFHYFDKGNLATVGRSFAVADLGKIRLSGLIAWLAWVVVHIYYLIGFHNRFMVLSEWAWAYLTFGRGARLIARATPPEAEAEAPAEITRPGSGGAFG